MLGQLRRLLAACWTYYETVWRLDLLDDRLLADAGLCRKEIRARARRESFAQLRGTRPERRTRPAYRVPVIRRDRPARIS